MKSIITYYLLIFLPLIAFAIIIRMKTVSANYIMAGLLVYALIYHPLVSGLRLLANNKIRRSEFLLSFIPFWNAKYFGFLFFNK